MIGERKGRKWLRLGKQGDHPIRQQHGPRIVFPIDVSEPHSGKDRGQRDAGDHDAELERH